MVTVLIFITSLLLLAGLFLLKAMELRRGGATMLVGARHRADYVVEQGVRTLERRSRYLIEISFREALIRGLHGLALLALHVVRSIEKRLVRVIAFIRGKRNLIIDRKQVVSDYSEHVIDNREHHTEG